MVDYIIPNTPGLPFPKTGGSFNMEEESLMALLECPLCSRQLDASAKVLPCQHTFCISCLQEQERAHSQLHCPECRAPIPARTVAELPENVLLVRLLEGLNGNTQKAHYAVPSSRDVIRVKEDNQQESQLGGKGHYENSLRNSLYTQRGDRSGELVFTPTNDINLNHTIEDNWDHEDTGYGSRTSVGALQAASRTAQLQTSEQIQSPALCRAMCDFEPEEMNLEDSKYCLSFHKGDILTAIRRVDESWIEAKLGDRVGICPQQYLEPNSSAATLLKGRSRKWGDSAKSHHGGTVKATDVTNWPAHYSVPSKTPILNALPAAGGNFYQTWSNIGSCGSFNGQPLRFTASRGHYHSRRIPRHSDSHRHLSQSEKKMTNEIPPTISMALVNPQMPSASSDSRNSSTQQLSISVCAVLYSYKPRRPEELELRKGEMVGVYGKFKEGWLRGLSLRTGKVGILPSNYITPVLRTSARILESRAANASAQYNAIAAKKPTAAKNPAVVLALDKVNGDGAPYSTGQVTSLPNGAQHAASSAVPVKPSFYGSAQGWDTVRRIFNPHRGSTRSSHTSAYNFPSNSQHFAQVQASGYSPALQRKKNSNILSNSSKLHGWMTEPTSHSAGSSLNSSDFSASLEALFHHRKHPINAPQSILVKPNSHKNNTDKPPKSVRFLTSEESPPPRHRTSSWSSGTQVNPNYRSGPPPLEVWAPSLTLGRDGPGITINDGKSPALNSYPQKPPSSQPSQSALSAKFSPSRHRVITTHLAQTDSELSLLQGELVHVHRPRPDGRVLVTQEGTGQTGLFQSNVLQALERLS